MTWSSASPANNDSVHGARAEQALGPLQRLGYRDAHNGGAALSLARQLGLALRPGL